MADNLSHMTREELIARGLSKNQRLALKALVEKELEIGTDITRDGAIDMVKTHLAYKWGFYLWATNDGRAVAAELAKQEGM